MSRMVMVALLGLSACIGASSDDVEFPVDASPIDRPMSMLADIDGTFLLSVRAGFEGSNNPDFYLQMIATWNLELAGSNAVLAASFVPLCVHASCNGMRDQLPPALIDSNSSVTANGAFEQTVSGQLPAGANPFSGTAQPIGANLEAAIIDADLVCGSVTGTVAGLDLTGSTFAAIRVLDTTPANLPAPLADCPF